MISNDGVDCNDFLCPLTPQLALNGVKHLFYVSIMSASRLSPILSMSHKKWEIKLISACVCVSKINYQLPNN